MQRRLLNSYSASRDNWCTATLWNRIMTAQCEGMGEVGSARCEEALLPPCPSIRALCFALFPSAAFYPTRFFFTLWCLDHKQHFISMRCFSGQLVIHIWISYSYLYVQQSGKTYILGNNWQRIMEALYIQNMMAREWCITGKLLQMSFCNI